MAIPPLNWSAVNTALIVATGGYLWRQARKVDVIYQAFFGVNGRNGLLRRVDAVEQETKTVDARIKETRHDIRNEFQVSILQLHDEFDKRMTRAEDKT